MRVLVDALRRICALGVSLTAESVVWDQPGVRWWIEESQLHLALGHTSGLGTTLARGLAGWCD